MASNELELIIKAVDNASDVISKVSSEVQGMASEVDSAVENVDADKLANKVFHISNKKL